MTSVSPVVVAGYFPPPQTGGTLATERLAALLEDTVPVERLSLQPNGGLGSVAGSTQHLVRRALNYASAALRWRQVLSRSTASAVLWPSVSGQPLGHVRDRLLVLPAFKRRQRVYGVVHWGEFHRLSHPLLRPTVRRMAQQLAGLVFLDRSLADACADFVPPEKRFVIPNTLDDVFLETTGAPRSVRLPSEPWRLLFVSNMLREKGWETVLETVSRLSARATPVLLTLAGGWPDDSTRAAFDRLVAERGLGAIVEHLGPVHDRQVLRRLYQNHDVLVFPTFYPTEAQPLVVIEALACGTPVVATSQGGMGGMFDDGVEGMLVPPNDPDALVAALDGLLASPERWASVSRAARARFERQFSPDAVRQQWLALLDGTLSPA